MYLRKRKKMDRFKKLSYTSLLLIFSCLHLNGMYLTPDTLVRKQQLSFNGSVESVSWCCDADEKFVVVAGNPCDFNDPSVIVYEIENGLLKTPAFDTLILGENNFNIYPGTSVEWCCTEVPELLAIGGAFSTSDCADDGGVQIYSKGPSQLDFMATFTHGGKINAVAWLCGCCDDDHNPVIAIAGEAGDCGTGNEIRILEFDPTNTTFNPIASFTHGAPIYSLDWCCRSGSSRAYLAAGGQPAECGGPNLGIYVLVCKSGGQFEADVVTNSQTTGADLHAVRWCCDPNSKYLKLAVGGKPNGSGINTQIYNLFNNRFSKFVDKVITNTTDPATIFTIDWNPLCSCQYVTYGTGCQETCGHNLFVYKINRQNSVCSLDLVTSTNFDENITSLEWCSDTKGAYLIVGASPESQCVESKKEIALYKAAFCQLQAGTICNRIPT